MALKAIANRLSVVLISTVLFSQGLMASSYDLVIDGHHYLPVNIGNLASVGFRKDNVFCNDDACRSKFSPLLWHKYLNNADAIEGFNLSLIARGVSNIPLDFNKDYRLFGGNAFEIRDAQEKVIRPVIESGISYWKDKKKFWVPSELLMVASLYDYDFNKGGFTYQVIINDLARGGFTPGDVSVPACKYVPIDGNQRINRCELWMYVVSDSSVGMRLLVPRLETLNGFSDEPQTGFYKVDDINVAKEISRIIASKKWFVRAFIELVNYDPSTYAINFRVTNLKFYDQVSGKVFMSVTKANENPSPRPASQSQPIRKGNQR